MEYLILIDENGHRITSLVVGIHGSTIDDLKTLASEYNPHTMLEATEREQQLFLQGKIYIDGKFIEPPAYEPTVEELKEAIINKYNNDIKMLKSALLACQLANEPTEAIEKQFLKIKEEYLKKLGAIE